ncbi:MAG TPA: hypothetical protein VFG72_14485 [Marmoricola sp.]|nr:hypothetical protein [Marmoricola sp.]
MSDYPPGSSTPGASDSGSSPSGSTPPPGSGDPGRPPPPPPPGGSGGGWGSAPPPPPPPPGSGGYGAPPPPPPGAPGGYGYPPGPGGPAGPGGYSVGKAFSYAFDKFRANWAPLVLVTLVLLVGAGIVQGLQRLVTPAADDDLSGGFFGVALLLSAIFSALSWAVQLIVQSVIVKGSLDVTRGRRLDLGSATSGIDWGQVIIASLIIGAMTFVGILLCILPGIAVLFFTSYTLYFIIDRGEDAVTAIKSSFTMVKNNLGVLLLFFLASLAAWVVGLCACVVGLLVAIPVVVLAQAYTFRMLNGDPVTT